jgi:ribosomal subunit interface protein
MLPIQITVHDLPDSQALEDCIHKKIKKLEQLHQQINSCRVLIEATQKHKRQGKLYSVHIDLTVPGKELAVNRKCNEDLYVAIRDAFFALERQLETYVRKRRGEVKKRGRMKTERARFLFKEDILH